jgi:ribosomal-protein-alanine N-acetyltransferase
MAEPEITLRSSTPADAEQLVAWRSEPSAARYQPLQALSLAALRAQLRRRSGVPLDRSFAGKAQWIVERDGVPAGWISLTVLDREHGRGAVGYTIGEAFRGQGCATAAVRQLIALAFDPTGLGLARLEAVEAVGNRASQRVLERAGFTREGCARGLLMIDGRRVDHYRYGLLRDDSYG